ncbi:MAG: transporter substrate-binding domain-containing protein [Desulfobacterales bacterium]|nr:transporter substrate-binding domain-containing protein [Desulfobacterales bacterium]MCP4160228.1 transporter substrate-binding domain-containing protein [Deltaproteobacteria bacterium]
MFKNIFIILTIILCIGLNSVYARNFKIACNDYAPYHYPNDNKVKGYVVELIDAVMKRMGHSAEFKIYPWKRCLYSSKSGMVDGIAFIFKNNDRSKWLHYQKGNVIAYERIAFYKIKGFKFSYDGDLSKIKDRIGVISGMSYGPKFDTAIPSLKIEGVNSVKILLKKIVKGRHPLLVNNTMVTDWYGKKMGFTNKIERVNPPISKNNGYIAFSKKTVTETLSKQFAKALTQFKQTAKFKKIQKKYSVD